MARADLGIPLAPWPFPQGWWLEDRNLIIRECKIISPQMTCEEEINISKRQLLSSMYKAKSRGRLVGKAVVLGIQMEWWGPWHPGKTLLLPLASLAPLRLPGED